MLAALAGPAELAHADIVPPVNLQLKESDGGTVLVQWKVPAQIPAEASPAPYLPEQCQSEGDREEVEQATGRIFTESFDCGSSLGGADVGIDFPFYNTTFSTLVRAELRSREQFVHVLEPGEDRWTLPEGTTGLRQDPWTNLKLPVVAGLNHCLGGWVHLALVVALGLLGGRDQALAPALAFFVGQLAAVVLMALSVASLPPPLAEVGVALAIAVLAAQLLTPVEKRSGAWPLLLGVGFIHGLGLGTLATLPTSFDGVEWLYYGLMALGMDAVLIVGVVLVARIGSWLATASWSPLATRLCGCSLGSAGFAAALALVLLTPAPESEARESAAGLPGLSALSTSAVATGSRALAPQGSSAPVQLFVTIGPFETRLETMLRLGDLAVPLQIEQDGLLEIEEQSRVEAIAADWVASAVSLRIDGSFSEPEVERVDFLEVGTQGVLPRVEPRPEAISRATLGVTLSYVTATTPEEIRVQWTGPILGSAAVPLTVTDPEGTRSVELTTEVQEFAWSNELVEDPVPAVESVMIEPRNYLVPLFSVPLFAVAIWFLVKVARRRNPTPSFAWSRLCIAAALVVAPNGRLDIEVEASAGAQPTVDEARSILLGVLPNIYRAFEFRDESAVYDRLAVNVTGQTLSEIYLEHRRALEMEERGGAQARVEAVEVPEVRSVGPGDDGSFEVDATWLVGGTVTHFGHRHFRQNRYDALVALVPVDGVWKIGSIEILSEERMK